MSVQTTNDDSIPRNDIPNKYNVSNTSDGLTLHDPDSGTVIDVWKRKHGQLLDQYPYKIEVVQNQETLFEAACESSTKATDTAIKQTQNY